MTTTPDIIAAADTGQAIVFGALAVDPQAEKPRASPAVEVDVLRSRRPRPQVEITNEAIAFDTLSDLLADRRAFPTVYVRAGALCRLDSEDAGEGVSRGYSRPVLRPMTPDNLRAQFAENVTTYITKTVGKGEEQVEKQIPTLVMRGTCATLVNRSSWPGVPVLRGVVTSPVLRPDGTLVQRPGFDPATGLYYHHRLKISPVPDRPDRTSVDWARNVVSTVFSDFPFVAPSDRAQYIGSLFTPIIRPYAPGPTPLVAITATSPASGKSLLKDVYGYLFGAEDVAWTSEEPELRKRITAKLIEGGAPVLSFDNVPNGGTIRSATLASLLTISTWGDRVLGVSQTVNVPNDRLWVATGNNLRTGGDIARRTVWVRLDPDCPDPGARDDFAVGDLRPWMEQHAGDLLMALLVLVADWVAAGAPVVRARVADYSRWMGVVGGILQHAEIPGWLADREATAIAMDEEAGEWLALLGAMHEQFGDRYTTVRQIMIVDAISDLIPRERDDQIPSARRLGKWFAARKGTYYGPYKLVSDYDSHAKQQVWAVKKDPGSRPEAPGGTVPLPRQAQGG